MRRLRRRNVQNPVPARPSGSSIGTRARRCTSASRGARGPQRIRAAARPSAGHTHRAPDAHLSPLASGLSLLPGFARTLLSVRMCRPCLQVSSQGMSSPDCTTRRVLTHLRPSATTSARVLGSAVCVLDAGIDGRVRVSTGSSTSCCVRYSPSVVRDRLVRSCAWTARLQTVRGVVTRETTV